MFPFKKKKADAHPLSLKKADVLITGMLLGGVVASIYGINKARKNAQEDTEAPERTETENAPNKPSETKSGFGYRLYHAIRYGKDVDKD